MINVIGVRFRNAGKVYYFDPNGMDIKRGAHVIVETARGLEMGQVVLSSTLVEEEKIIQPLKSVIRIANAADERQEQSNKVKEKEALVICRQKVAKHNLEMKLIDTEYTFDGSKILFYFTADGRIDFRELVKDLASVFKTRIELRQIGVRDETKIRGGIGVCGRPLCCNTYLSEFAPVSIKMAKEQGLSLNPTKISGVCGRLMCCLKNEQETYEELNSRLPSIGDYVMTADGKRGEVKSVSVLRQQVKLIITVNDEKELVEYPVAELTFRSKVRKNATQNDLEVQQFTEVSALEQLEPRKKHEKPKSEDKRVEFNKQSRYNKPKKFNKQNKPNKSNQSGDTSKKK